MRRQRLAPRVCSEVGAGHEVIIDRVFGIPQPHVIERIDVLARVTRYDHPVGPSVPEEEARNVHDIIPGGQFLSLMKAREGACSHEAQVVFVLGHVGSSKFTTS